MCGQVAGWQQLEDRDFVKFANKHLQNYRFHIEIISKPGRNRILSTKHSRNKTRLIFSRHSVRLLSEKVKIIGLLAGPKKGIQFFFAEDNNESYIMEGGVY